MQMAATEFSDTSDGTPTTLRIYLAGPDVFLPQPRQWAEWKKAVCARHGLIGISPLDDAPDDTAGPGALPEWQRIALRNEALIRSADAMIANLTPFRGPSADVGTAYEVGFIRALGRPVFGYSTTAMPFTQRSRDFAMGHGGALAGRDRSLRDADGMLIEQFGLTDNLMLEAAVVGSGGLLIVEDVAPDTRWSDLSVFERCAKAAASVLRRQAMS
jgi:nucleoside 2-deoxyribosyltransferase